MIMTSSSKPEVSVILATYNEKEHILLLIRELTQKITQTLEIIVVDDHSEDGTAELVAGLADPRVILIQRKVRGLASAFHRGIIESTGEIICWMDADMCMPVDTLIQMIERLKECDLAIGSRYAPGGVDDRPPLRVWSSRFINGVARLVLGGQVRDYDSGFVALHRRVFNSVTLIPFGYGEYFIEMIYDATRKGMKICEVGYYFRDRAEGVSKSIPNVFRFFVTGSHYLFRILTLRFRFLRGGN